MARLTLELTRDQRRELEQVRDRDPKAYLREKAAALIKIADGMSPHAVARHGLLKPRDPDSVYDWLRRYQEGGLAALRIRRGRGRKPAYFPESRRAGSAGTD
jgi:transposase